MPNHCDDNLYNRGLILVNNVMNVTVETAGALSVVPECDLYLYLCKPTYSISVARFIAICVATIKSFRTGLSTVWKCIDIDCQFVADTPCVEFLNLYLNLILMLTVHKALSSANNRTHPAPTAYWIKERKHSWIVDFLQLTVQPLFSEELPGPAVTLVRWEVKHNNWQLSYLDELIQERYSISSTVIIFNIFNNFNIFQCHVAPVPN